MDEKATTPAQWTKADTMEYLSTNPLPQDFAWRHKNGQLTAVQPSYAVSDYGKWLHDTPYFQGLFELIHDLILAAGSTLPDIGAIVAQLNQIRREREGQGKLF
jgi:hypothetical protein